MIAELPIDALRLRVRTLYRDAFITPHNPTLLLRACEELQTALDFLHSAQTTTREQAKALEEYHVHSAIEHDDYQNLFTFAPDAYLVTSLDGTIHKANQAALTLFNQAADQIIGRPLGMFVPDGERRAFRAELIQTLAVERKEDWHLRLQRRSGETFIASVSVRRICNMLQRPTTLRWQVRDVTRQQTVIAEQQRHLKALEQRLQELEQPAAPTEAHEATSHTMRVRNDMVLFLMEAMVMAALAADVSALTRVAQLAVPRFADLCLVDYLSMEGSVERVAVIFADPQQQPLARELRRGASDRLEIQADTPILYTDTPDSNAIDHLWRTYVARDERQVRALQDIAPVSTLIVPLHNGNDVFGQLVFVSTTPERHYTPYEQAFTSAIANRVALALMPTRAAYPRVRAVGEQFIKEYTNDEMRFNS